MIRDEKEMQLHVVPMEKETAGIRGLLQSKGVTAVLILMLCLWQIPFIGRGIDYTDTGFALTYFKQAFSEVGINGIGMFFSNLIGGLVYAIAPSTKLFKIPMIVLFNDYYLKKINRIGYCSVKENFI